MRHFIAVLALAIAVVACQDRKNNTESAEGIPDPDTHPVLTTAETIAFKNGLENWDDVTEIQFTFNVDRGENHFERSWSWKPKSNEVTLRSADDTLTYNRNDMDSIAMKTDGGFINDSYWLLAPFKLVWDEGTTLSESDRAVAPISGDSLHKITLTYGNEGGYTPGDAYDFFYGDDFMVKEWIFRKGNQEAPSMITTFEDYKDFNGLQLAQMHKDSTGALKLYFTDISVKR